jgi:hypothetical protein
MAKKTQVTDNVPFQETKTVVDKTPEEKRILTIADLVKACKESPEVDHMRRQIGYNISPQFKRILIKTIDWHSKVITDSGLIIAMDHTPDKPSKERGERPSMELQRAIIVEVASDCREDFVPGMHIMMMPQEGMGFSTRIRVPQATGVGSDELRVIQEHEILGVIIEDRIVALKDAVAEQKAERGIKLIN